VPDESYEEDDADDGGHDDQQTSALPLPPLWTILCVQLASVIGDAFGQRASRIGLSLCVSVVWTRTRVLQNLAALLVIWSVLAVLIGC